MDIKTLGEAIAAGYTRGDAAYQRGYVSRKAMPDENRPVFVAGGRRKGQLYYLAPCADSTQYCYRIYLHEVTK